jgi:hypothetical protein
MAMNLVDVPPTLVTKDLVESLQSIEYFVAGNFRIAVAMECFGFEGAGQSGPAALSDTTPGHLKPPFYPTSGRRSFRFHHPINKINQYVNDSLTSQRSFLSSQMMIQKLPALITVDRPEPALKNPFQRPLQLLEVETLVAQPV